MYNLWALTQRLYTRAVLFLYEMDYLTHYYKKGDQPFRSLSFLPDSEAIRVAQGFQGETAVVYRRFKEPEKYWSSRRRTERWVREAFIHKGGVPTVDHPQYMVLGSSFFISEGYNLNCDEIRIPLSDFDESEISFTYPDSMVSLMLLEERQEEQYFHPEYHGKVFTLLEIVGVVEEFGLPVREWEKDPKRKYDFFVEAQVWTDRIFDEHK